MKKIFTSFIILTTLTINAQNIALDQTFGSNGITSIPLVGEGDDLQILISQDNKILASGKDLPASTSINPNKIYKLNLDGSLDNAFANSGTLILPNYIGDFKVVLQGSDKILVVFQKTNSTAPTYRSILRYNLNGTLDSTFGTNGEIQIPFVGSIGFRYNNLVVLSDNSLLLADGINYTKFTANGVIDNSFGTNGILNKTNSANIQNSNSDLFNFYTAKIDKTTTTATLVSSFGNSGTYTYPTTSDYYSKQTSAGNINSLDLNNNTFYNINSAGNLQNSISLTNDNNTLDYYSNFVFDGSRYFFVGSSVNGVTPFIVCYDSSGNLIPLNGLNSYKENLISTGNSTSVLFANNAIYVGGDKTDATSKWFYTISKYNFTTLGTSEINSQNTISFENPIKSNLNYQSLEKVSKIDIYTTDGKLVKTIKENNANISELTKGIYFLKIEFLNGKTNVKKLIKN